MGEPICGTLIQLETGGIFLRILSIREGRLPELQRARQPLAELLVGTGTEPVGVHVVVTTAPSLSAPNPAQATAPLLIGSPGPHALLDDGETACVAGRDDFRWPDRCSGILAHIEQVVQTTKNVSSAPLLLVEFTPLWTTSLTDAALATISTVLDHIRASGFLERTVVSSSDWRILRAARRREPMLRFWFKTYPLSWYIRGLPPEFAAASAGERAAPDAWLDGLQPQIPDFASAIKSAGGKAWLIHHSDFDSSARDQITAANLTGVIWFFHRLHAGEWRRLLDCGMEAYCADDDASLDAARDIKGLIEVAERAFKAKESQRAARVALLLIDAYTGLVPARIFQIAAVTLRRLDRRTDSELILNRGFRRFPGEACLLEEYAALEMARGNWDNARQRWEDLEQKTGHSFSALNYNRYAKCCERCGTTAEYERVLTRAIKKYPQHVDLLWRSIHAAAAADLGNQHWSAASWKLELLQACPTEIWPMATQGLRKKASVGVELQNLQATDDALPILGKATTRASALRFAPSDVVGISMVLDWIQANKRGSVAGLSALRHAVASLEAEALRVDGMVAGHPTPAFDAANAQLASVLATHEFPGTLLPKECWCTLANLMLLGRYLDVYQKLRDNILVAIQRETMSAVNDLNSADTRALRDLVRYVAERGDRAYFERLQAAYRDGRLNLRARNAAILHICALYFGDLASFRSGMDRDVPAFQDYRRELVQGKSIAIVAPVDVGLDNGSEIDSFDVVIRFNYRGLEGYDTRRFGSRTDISMLIQKDLPKGEIDQRQVERLNTLKLLLVDNSASLANPTIRAVSSPVHLRYPTADAFTNPFVKGSANAAQRALMDWLRFSPSRVKVFNANFFCENRTVPVYRKANYAALDFVRHDPVSNFVIVKRLFEFGVIEADEVLGSILRMTPTQYISRLHSQYGVAASAYEA